MESNPIALDSAFWGLLPQERNTFIYPYFLYNRFFLLNYTLPLFHAEKALSRFNDPASSFLPFLPLTYYAPLVFPPRVISRHSALPLLPSSNSSMFITSCPCHSTHIQFTNVANMAVDLNDIDK